MKDCPDVPILITQSRLCKNAYDEVDFFPQIGNEYYATVIGAVFHADEIITSLRSDEICFQGMEHTRTLTYGEAENFIDSGIALLHPECILLARTVGMAIVLIKHRKIHYGYHQKNRNKSKSCCFTQRCGLCQTSFVRGSYFLSIYWKSI